MLGIRGSSIFGSTAFRSMGSDCAGIRACGSQGMPMRDLGIRTCQKVRNRDFCPPKNAKIACRRTMSHALYLGESVQHPPATHMSTRHRTQPKYHSRASPRASRVRFLRKDVEHVCLLAACPWFTTIKVASGLRRCARAHMCRPCVVHVSHASLSPPVFACA